MELSSYRIFEAVASLGSMVKAADALYLTPSAVSHAVLKLEKEFGFPLFIRDKKKTVLTAYGQEILPKVRALLLVHNNLDEEVSTLRGTTRGTMHIGTFNSTCCFWLTKILPLFREKYPHIEVVVREGGYADCEEWLITQQIDLAFVVLDPRQEKDYDRTGEKAHAEHPTEKISTADHQKNHAGKSLHQVSG